MVVLTEEEYKKLKNQRKIRLHKKAAKYKQKLSQKIQKQSMKKQRYAKSSNKHDILHEYFMPQHQSMAKALISDLLKSGAKITNNRELQVSHGDTVFGSDVVELVKELLVGSRFSVQKPKGWPEFVNAVADSDAPLSMISKSVSRNLIKKIRQESNPWIEY